MQVILARFNRVTFSTMYDYLGLRKEMLKLEKKDGCRLFNSAASQCVLPRSAGSTSTRRQRAQFQRVCQYTGESEFDDRASGAGDSPYIERAAYLREGKKNTFFPSLLPPDSRMEATSPLISQESEPASSQNDSPAFSPFSGGSNGIPGGFEPVLSALPTLQPAASNADATDLAINPGEVTPELKGGDVPPHLPDNSLTEAGRALKGSSPSKIIIPQYAPAQGHRMKDRTVQDSELQSYVRSIVVRYFGQSIGIRGLEVREPQMQETLCSFNSRPNSFPSSTNASATPSSAIMEQLDARLGMAANKLRPEFSRAFSPHISRQAPSAGNAAQYATKSLRAVTTALRSANDEYASSNSQVSSQMSTRSSSLASLNIVNAESILENEVQVLYYKEGDILVNQGEKNAGLFFVIDGWLDISVTYDDRKAREKLLRDRERRKSEFRNVQGVSEDMAKEVVSESGNPSEQNAPKQQLRSLFAISPGGVAGSVSAVTGCPSFVTIRARTDAYVGHLSSSSLERLIDRCPTLLLSLSKELTNQLSPLVLQIDFALDGSRSRQVRSCTGKVMSRIRYIL